MTDFASESPNNCSPLVAISILDFFFFFLISNSLQMLSPGRSLKSSAGCTRKGTSQRRRWLEPSTVGLEQCWWCRRRWPSRSSGTSRHTRLPGSLAKWCPYKKVIALCFPLGGKIITKNNHKEKAEGDSLVWEFSRGENLFPGTSLNFLGVLD